MAIATISSSTTPLFPALSLNNLKNTPVDDTDANTSTRPQTTPQQPAQQAAPEQQTQAEQKLINELSARDLEVRTHEAAHLSAAGIYAKGGPSFSFQRGPDGKQYAVGGEVNIDTSPIPGDPEATIRKAQTLQRAALAPAEPSSQDRSVAASATQLELQARTEQTQARENDQDNNEETTADSASVDASSTDNENQNETDTISASAQKAIERFQRNQNITETQFDELA